MVINNNKLFNGYTYELRLTNVNALISLRFFISNKVNPRVITIAVLLKILFKSTENELNNKLS